MNFVRAVSFSVPLAALALAVPGEARACGGCFVPTTEISQVTGHRMILSISQQQTTLWDQITYSGNPASMAWVLPVKGVADIGLSSDALFGELDQYSQVTIQAPSLACQSFGSSHAAGSGSAGAGGGNGGVTVVSQKVVGPYETVQLKTTDPAALETWLSSHSYNLPADIKPIVDEYVKEGFDFLALKLVPGMGVSAMRPVRVTTPGATPVLPLRMVAAGTGAITPITLWILGEGRYEPVDLPQFQIDPKKLVWDWDSSSSNYSVLVQKGFDASNARGWLIEAAEPFAKAGVASDLSYLVTNDQPNSGYGDPMGMGASAELMSDLTALWGNIADGSLWVTRVRGELSRAALAADLQLGAATSQTAVVRAFQTTNTIGTPPCTDSGAGGSGAGGAGGGIGGKGIAVKAGGGCATSPNRTSGAGSPLAGVLVAMGLLARRRRHG